MIKIAFIGAGSIGFKRELIRDILTFPLLKNANLALVEKIISLGKYPATATVTLERVIGCAMQMWC